MHEKLQARKAEALCAAAGDLFLERGFDAITMDDIGRAAGVSKTTLYAHFSNKESLFSAAMIREVRLIAERIWTSAAGIEDVREALRSIGENYFTVFTTERTFLGMRAVMGVIARFPALGRLIFEEGPATLQKNVSGFVADAHEAGRLYAPNASRAADQFLSLVRGDLDMRGLLYLERPTPSEMEDNLEAAIALFLDRYGAGGP